jgi:spermidine synthase
MMAVASGAASLAYQVVWMRRLALVFGSTTLATSTILAAFLAGLAIGSWTWGRLADRRPQSSLIIFAALEIVTGLYGFASLWVFRGVEALYLGAYPSLAGRASLATGVQFLLSALAILPPAVLMGGSLPLLARRTVTDTRGIIGSVGAVYAWTTLGAALGAAATTYGLLPAVGLASTVAAAAAVNVLVGATAFAVDTRSGKRDVPLNAAAVSMQSGVTDDSSDPVIEFLILIGFAASGFAATTFEHCWARLLGMVMGSSVYTYGTLAAVVLAGLGLGSAFYGRAERTTDAHQRRFALLEFLIAFTAALSIIVLPRIPFLFVRFFPLFRGAFGRQVAAHFVAAAMVSLAPSLLFGATFPAAVGSLSSAAVRFGRMIGAAYVANTIGTVAGVFLAGMVFNPTIGLRATMTLGVLATVGAGSAVWWRVRAPRLTRLQPLAPAVAALLLLGVLPLWPREVFAAGVGFFAPRYEGNEELGDIVSRMRLRYYRDGFSSTISVDETAQTLFYRSNGKTDASTDPVDMANQLLLGHIPMLLHPAPRDVFVLGLGTGLTAAAVARYAVQQIDVVELEPAAAQAARFFDSYTRKVLDDPRVRLIIGDGRNRLLGVPKQYDVVISDRCDIWVAGTGSLATLEYYRLVGARLKSGGIFAQRIDMHALLPDDLGLLAATFHAVFPHMQIWTSAPGNLIFLGARDSFAWDYTRLQQHFARTPGVADDLKSAGIWHPFALFAAQVLGENESDALASDIGQFLTDDRPVLEFRTPRSLYVETTPMIVDELNYYRRPEAPAIAGFDPQRDLDADGAYLLGFAYASVGRSDLAITYMERSIRMAPDRPMFFVGLGNQYRAVGLVSDASAAYERALALDLNNVEALVSLGEIRLEEGKLEWTRVLSDRALRLSPQDARVHALIDRLQEVER